MMSLSPRCFLLVADEDTQAEEDAAANSRGIPAAEFIVGPDGAGGVRLARYDLMCPRSQESVEAHILKQGKDVDAALKDLHMLYG